MTVDPSFLPQMGGMHLRRRARWVGVPAVPQPSSTSSPLPQVPQKVWGVRCVTQSRLLSCPRRRRPVEWLTVAESEPVAPK